MSRCSSPSPLQLPSKLEQARRFAVQSRQQLEGAQRAVPPARQAVSEAQEEVRRETGCDAWFCMRKMGFEEGGGGARGGEGQGEQVYGRGIVCECKG